MLWILMALGAALMWGMYGPILHKGQIGLGSPLKALLCVGFAYFLVGVLYPVIALGQQGDLKGLTAGGALPATIAGILGAGGALCIIYAFKSGGRPLYVMPLVFGLAPVINVIYSIIAHPPKTSPNPLLYVGFTLAAIGAALVMYFKPQS